MSEKKNVKRNANRPKANKKGLVQSMPSNRGKVEPSQSNLFYSPKPYKS